MIHDLAAALSTLLGINGGVWRGPAAELLALLPDAAPDATGLARRLTEASGDLAAVGVTLERKQGGGLPLLVLRLDAAAATDRLKALSPADAPPA